MAKILTENWHLYPPIQTLAVQSLVDLMETEWINPFSAGDPTDLISLSTGTVDLG